MKKKEVNEIKKIFSPANCTITRICGCYVDAEKNRRTEIKAAFSSLPADETYKYFNIFRSAMSGEVGKKLLNMEFPLVAEEEGGAQHFLLRLRDSALKDEALVEEFYDKLIASYAYGENYYIILIHCAYDIPAKSSDGLEMYDASDFVYEFVQCIICPVKLSKAGLYYNSEANSIQNRNRDWLVEVPDAGFLFPAFNDRNTDIHSLLFYTKNPEQMPERLIKETLGCVRPMSAKSQAETFQAIVEEVMGDNCNFETVKNIHESFYSLMEESKNETEQVTLNPEQIKKIMESNGADEENLKEFEKRYEGFEAQQPEFLLTNIVNHKNFDIKTYDVSIKVRADKANLLESRMIDGRPCIVIEVNENVEVNGINVKPIQPKTE